MISLFLAGRQTEALALYQRTRQRLALLTGMEPGAALQQTESAVLRHDVDDVLREILGIRRPRLRTARSLLAARDASGGRVEGGRREHGGRARTLPRFVNSFVGRNELVERTLAHSLQPGLVTLVGPGGVGKTRLVCEAIGHWDPELERPAWFCELAALDDGNEVRVANDVRGINDLHDANEVREHEETLGRLVARAIGARLEPGRRPFDAVAAALANIEGTLVLDSCETQVAQAAALASTTLGSCPGLTILATSRLPLGVEGEAVIVVPPLEVDSEATDLYCHRAIDADPGFSLDVDDLEAIARLCARLDGLPLAIELAAARSRTAGPHELLSYLDDSASSDLAHSPSFAGASRHRNVDTTIDWSYRLLNADQQQLLCRLAVFAGPVGIEDVAALCDDIGDRGALLEKLAELVERSMVATARHRGVTRYRLLDTIRVFAARQSARRGGLDHQRRRHALHYVDVLDDLRFAQRGPDEATALARIDEVWPEVRAAVAWSVRAQQAVVALGLVRGLGFEAELIELSDAQLVRENQYKSLGK